MKKEILETNYDNNEKFYFKKRLLDLGLSKNYLGFYFLTDICEMVINNDMIVRSFSHEIYPVVAKNFDIKSDAIERDIRVLINAYWSGGMCTKLKPFGGEEKMPTCCQFIKILCEYMKADLV